MDNNRKIEFIAWDKNLKIMYDFADICDYPLARLNNSVVFDFMQFTGITNKKKQKIFEKDIVIFKGNYYSVHYKESAFYLSSDLNGVHVHAVCFDVYDMMLDCEVVGNIFENPELLQQ